MAPQGSVEVAQLGLPAQRAQAARVEQLQGAEVQACVWSGGRGCVLPSAACAAKPRETVSSATTPAPGTLSRSGRQGGAGARRGS